MAKINLIQLNKLKNILESDKFAEMVIKQRMQCFHINSLLIKDDDVLIEVLRLGTTIVINLQIGDVIKRKQYWQDVNAKEIIADVRQNYYNAFKEEMK